MSETTSISPAEYRTWAALNPHVLIDVRGKHEWNEGHIDSAVHIPLSRLVEQVPHLVSNTKCTLVLYCAHGVRSRLAVALLRRAGYTDVRNLSGGLAAYTSNS